ncbi:hypothetical protein M514_05396 [Trichuris suis]|uniref:Uncharacterized protein n=1 Tax=Trichuris suis TaxID=68888 RepID=A0A085NSF7_9BILA|nr:hypothetical protein M513_05396 [Trichuris suis]KFD72403.1 hypothetical protein M514_05396 [Trichuris suis]
MDSDLPSCQYDRHYVHREEDFKVFALARKQNQMLLDDQSGRKAGIKCDWPQQGHGAMIFGELTLVTSKL